MKTTTTRRTGWNRHTARSEERAANLARTAGEIKGGMLTEEQIEILRKDLKNTAW